MIQTMRRVAWTFVTTALLAVTAVAAQSEPPATRPAPPPPVDQVVRLLPIALQIKGQSPQQALAALSRQSGVAIYPYAFKRDEAYKLTPFDLWGSREFPAIDFDVPPSSFWEAMRQILTYSQLGEIDATGTSDVVLVPQAYFGGFSDPWMVSDKPLVFARIPKEYSDVSAAGVQSLLMRVYLDPRVQLLDVSTGEITAARDETGREIDARLSVLPEQSSGHYSRWNLLCRWKVAFQPNAKWQVSALQGYLVATIATKVQTVRMDLLEGLVSSAGPWTLHLENLEFWGTASRSRSLNLVISLEKEEGANVPLPALLNWVVRLQDAGGNALSLDWAEPPTFTPSGGLRQQLRFNCNRANGEKAEPAKLLVDFPLEIKEVSLPFEFKGIEPLPK
jgi:hypothetical protein